MITKEHIRALPSFCGVYIFYANGTPIYIGKAIHIRARAMSHLTSSISSLKEKRIIDEADHIAVIEASSEFNALVLEAHLITKHKPIYNVRWRDDKSYLYIKISQSEKYPKVTVSRKEDGPDNLYFGPFSSRREVDALLREIRKVVPFCQASSRAKRGCFYSQIDLCDPCPQSARFRKSKTLHRTYHANIRKIILILKGKTSVVARQLEGKMKRYVSAEKYEQARDIRDRLEDLHRLLRRISFQNYSPEMLMKSPNTLRHEITTFLSSVSSGQNVGPTIRIECYDMSTFLGGDSTGSMVVYESGSLRKSQYRLFKIRDNNRTSDLDMIEEVLTRRFRHKEWALPTLILIDGGRPQVEVANAILKKLKLNIPAVGIAKKPDRIVSHSSRGSVKMTQWTMLFNLFKTLRDEAHRFARGYHLRLRDAHAMV